MDILMPQLGETVAEGTIIAWLKSEGDAVQVDEALVEIETDKAATEIPAPTTGVLTRILVPAGQTVRVGTSLAVIETGLSAGAPDPQVTPSPADAPAAAPPAPLPPVAAKSPGRWPREQKVDHAGKPLSPAVRRLVREYALDPQRISGAGRDGRIRRSDALAHLKIGAAAPDQHGTGATESRRSAGSVLVPFSRLRKRIAEHMVRSKAASPHVLQAVEVDFGSIVAVRAKYKAAFHERHGVPLTYLPFVAHALCRALGKYPALNASIEGHALRQHADVHLAVAVDLNHAGLVAPVVPRAQALTVTGLATRIHALVHKARSGTFTADEITGGTYTLSNSGSYGTFITAPIISQPQVAILSMDGIHKRAAVVESEFGDSIAIRPIGVLAQSFDHRAVDGAYSAAYLRALRKLLETSDWGALIDQ